MSDVAFRQIPPIGGRTFIVCISINAMEYLGTLRRWVENQSFHFERIHSNSFSSIVLCFNALHWLLLLVAEKRIFSTTWLPSWRNIRRISRKSSTKERISWEKRSRELMNSSIRCCQSKHSLYLAIKGQLKQIFFSLPPIHFTIQVHFACTRFGTDGFFILKKLALKKD